MVIKTGSAADATDIIKNTITYLEGINQATLLSKDASITDITYTFADSDAMSDSTGYNNTINTGQTTANFTTDRYFAQTSSSDESSAGETSRTGNTFGLTKTITLANNKKVTQHANQIKSQDATTNTCKVEFTYVDDTTYSVEQTTTSASYVAKTYTNSSPEKLVKIVKIYLKNSTTDKLSYEQNDVVTAFDFINGVIQTETKTFNANVKSILVSANKILNGSSTITVDVSTDGGSAFEKTGQALNTVIELDGDNTDVEIKLNMNISGTDTPVLFGYSYQVWT